MVGSTCKQLAGQKDWRDFYASAEHQYKVKYDTCDFSWLFMAASWLFASSNAKAFSCSCKRRPSIKKVTATIKERTKGNVGQSTVTPYTCRY